MSFAPFYKTPEFYYWLIAAKYHQADKSMISSAFAAMDSVCTTWWNQLHMDRRIDPADGKIFYFSAPVDCISGGLRHITRDYRILGQDDSFCADNKRKRQIQTVSWPAHNTDHNHSNVCNLLRRLGSISDSAARVRSRGGGCTNRVSWCSAPSTWASDPTGTPRAQQHKLARLAHHLRSTAGPNRVDGQVSHRLWQPSCVLCRPRENDRAVHTNLRAASRPQTAL